MSDSAESYDILAWKRGVSREVAMTGNGFSIRVIVIGSGCDGSVMPANPGVNPSLTITALAERAMSFWPNKGGADSRPSLGSGYKRLSPVMPHTPAVPAHAPGALRFEKPEREVIPLYPF
jgi:hypothetical protein